MSQAAVAETIPNTNSHDTSSTPDAAKRVAVIGTGAAGLCAAKHLLEVGFDLPQQTVGRFTIDCVQPRHGLSGRDILHDEVRLDQLVHRWSDLPRQFPNASILTGTA